MYDSELIINSKDYAFSKVEIKEPTKEEVEYVINELKKRNLVPVVKVWHDQILHLYFFGKTEDASSFVQEVKKILKDKYVVGGKVIRERIPDAGVIELVKTKVSEVVG